MLGDMIVEGRGKVTGVRVMENGVIELTAMCRGKFLDDEVNVIYTAERTPRPDGTEYAEVRGVLTGKSGAAGQFKCNGNTRTDANVTRIVRGAMCLSFPPGKFAQFNGQAIAYEMETDKEGNVQVRGWAWK